MVLASVGRHGEAQDLLHQVLAHRSQQRERGAWPWHGSLGRAALTLSADTAALLGDEHAASALVSDLAHIRGRLVVLPGGVVCLGSYDHYRARLHLVLGDDGAAMAAFERSEALHAAAGARPFVARDRLGMAVVLQRLGAGSGRIASLRRTGLAIVRELGLRDPLSVAWADGAEPDRTATA